MVEKTQKMMMKKVTSQVTNKINSKEQQINEIKISSHITHSILI